MTAAPREPLSGRVRVEMDPSGMGKVYLVFMDDVLIWSYPAHLEPDPGAINLWQALADRLAFIDHLHGSVPP